MIGTLLEAYPLPDLFPIIGPFLNWLVGVVGDMGLAIIIFTIAVKLVTLPIDYWSRANMKKNNLKLERMRPQLEKLQKQYANDQMLYNQKIQALYKKEGYSALGSCVPTLVTLVVFILIFRAFNGYLKYNLIDAYNKMYEAYLAVGEDPVKWAAVASDYQAEFMPSFLWIKNLWVADAPWAKSVMLASAFETSAGVTVDATLSYNPMIAPFIENQTVNGFLILPALSIGMNFLSQWITSKTQNSAADLQGGSQAQSMKIMMYMMPIMMGVFAASWTAAFALYIVTSSIYSIFSTLLINAIVNAKYKKVVEKEEEQTKRIY